MIELEIPWALVAIAVIKFFELATRARKADEWMAEMEEKHKRLGRFFQSLAERHVKLQRRVDELANQQIPPTPWLRSIVKDIEEREREIGKMQ